MGIDSAKGRSDLVNIMKNLNAKDVFKNFGGKFSILADLSKDKKEEDLK